jgi:hypothetical protein
LIISRLIEAGADLDVAIDNEDYEGSNHEEIKHEKPAPLPSEPVAFRGQNALSIAAYMGKQAGADIHLGRPLFIAAHLAHGVTCMDVIIVETSPIKNITTNYDPFYSKIIIKYPAHVFPLEAGADVDTLIDTYR